MKFKFLIDKKWMNLVEGNIKITIYNKLFAKD